MADVKLFEIPYHPDLRIDKQYNIYAVDSSDAICSVIPWNSVKFEYDHNCIYVMDLINMTFYGTIDRFKFDKYDRISDTEIVSNGVVFKQIPDVADGYFISDKGIVFSTFTNMILKQEVDDDGYHRISFHYPNLTHMAIHRLVYKAWKGAIPKNYVVHHKNNRKWDNDVNNLQLTTAFLNSRYAAEDGLYRRTFEWTSEVVHEVCRMMEDNISVKDIAACFGVFPENKVIYKNFRNQLYQFRTHHRSWIDITSQYNFNDYTGNIRPDSKYRNTDIQCIREMYKNGKSIDEIHSIYDKVSRRYLVAIINGKKRKIAS